MDENQFGFDVVGTGDDGFDVRRALHHEKRVEIVVKDLGRVVDSLQDVSVGFWVGFGLHLEFFEFFDDAVEFLFETPLFFGLFGNLLDLFLEFVKALFKNELQGEFVIGLDLIHPACVRDFLPVMLLFDEGLSGQELDQPESFSELFNIFFHGVDNVGGSFVVFIVEFFHQFDCFFEVFSVDGLLELGKIVF